MLCSRYQTDICNNFLQVTHIGYTEVVKSMLKNKMPMQEQKK